MSAVQVASASLALNTALRSEQPSAPTLRKLMKALDKALQTSLASAQAACAQRGA